MRRAIQAMLGVVAVSQLGAQPPAPKSNSGIPSACSILTAADIKRITKRSDLATGKGHLEASEYRSNCTYSGAQGIGVTVTDIPASMYNKTRDMYKNAPPTYKLITYERATGIGDDAYFLTHNDTQNVVKLVSRIGNLELTIAMERGNGEKPQVLALAKAAAAKLR